MKKEENKFITKRKWNKFKDISANKAEVLALVLFILSIFLLDVNANIIGAYGPDVNVNIIEGIRIPSTWFFWIGFLGALVFFLILALRQKYRKKKYNSFFETLFIIVGTVGLMIILSGGMLLFWHDNYVLIPLFTKQIARITYYHIGITLELLTILYFALTK